MNPGLVKIVQSFPSNVIDNVFVFGSHVYGTAGDKSDKDFIVVGDFKEAQSLSTAEGDLHLWPREYFLKQIDECEISALECLFLPRDKQLHGIFDVPLNLENLRKAISAKASNSFVKAKKKLIVENKPYLAQKSLFHSLRILSFGIQLAKTEKIYDLQSANVYWEEIKAMPLDYGLWKERFQPIYNQLKTEFKLATDRNGG